MNLATALKNKVLDVGWTCNVAEQSYTYTSRLIHYKIAYAVTLSVEVSAI